MESLSPRRTRESAPRRSLAILAAALAGLTLQGCWGSSKAPLPPETDLYAYSLAVAEKARREVPGRKALATFHVGRVHERFGKEDTAIEVYRKALDADPELADAYVRIGFILSQRKDRMPEAVEAYQQALRSRPGMPGVHSRLGLVLTHLGRLDDAHRELDAEVRSGTADEDTHYYIGQAYALQGKHAEAVASFEEALRQAPTLRTAAYGLAQSLRILGKTEEEKKALEKFQEIKRKEDEAASAAGTAKDTRGEMLRAASETWMDVADLHVAEASAEREGPRRQALVDGFVHAVEEAIRLDPTHVEPRTVLIDHHRTRGNLEAAVRACEEALEAFREESSLATKAYELAEMALERTQPPRADLAYRLLRAAIDSVSVLPDARRELAKLILFRLDRPDLLPEALQNAVKAVEQSPDVMNYDVLAFAYYKSGKPGDAVRTLEEGIRNHPEDETLKDRLRKFLEKEGPRPR